MRRRWAAHAGAIATMIIVATSGCVGGADASRHAPRELAVETPAATPAAARGDDALPPITAPADATGPAAPRGPIVVPVGADGADAGIVTLGPTSATVGDGTRASCTAEALERAVRQGGRVDFDCGGPARIVLPRALDVCTVDACGARGRPLGELSIDGGGLVTLVGSGADRILTVRGCAASDGGCDAGTMPRITLRGLTLEGGVAPAGADGTGLGLAGGGAIAMVGGRLTLDGVALLGNQCADPVGSEGGAVLARDMSAAVMVTGSTFSGNACGSGGAIAVIDAPLRVAGSTVVDNLARTAGGGLLVRTDGESAEISTSMVAGNTAPRGPAIDHVSVVGALDIRDSRITADSIEDPAVTVRSIAD